MARAIVEYKCDYCGKETSCLLNEYKRNKHHFCDTKCFYKFNREKNSYKYNQVKFNCEWCGIENSTNKGQYDRAKKHFCSKECLMDYKRRNNVKTTCFQCGKEITVIKHIFDLFVYHFCDKKCKGEWHSEQMKGDKNPGYIGDYKLICSNCNKKFTRGRSRSIKDGQNVFCSKKCEGEWSGKYRTGENAPRWEGGITPLLGKTRNSKKYKEWRTAVFKRDGYVCQECGDHNYIGRGSSLRLEAHHIKEFNIILKENNIMSLQDAYQCDELWDISNGMTLCLYCHNKKPIKRYKEAVQCM